MSEEIEKTLKRIGEGLVQVYIRGGKIVKIPKQLIKGLLKDNVRETKEVEEDITEN